MQKRLDVLGVLWRRGFPATMMTPVGLMPAVIVWVDTPDDPALELLRRAFGGLLMLEMRNHHGEESPAFWIGVGRSAVLALGVVLGAYERRDRLVGRGSGVGWGGVGMPRAELLGESAAAAWRGLEAIVELELRGEQGEPGPPRGEVAERQRELEALVAATFSLAPHISGGLNTVLAGRMRDAGFAINLTLPSRAERDAWVAAFLAPLLR